ncbi:MULTISPECIES: zinc ribbon domain-containing protein [Calothrix]|uniref:zinc ribbon domain-containing protein n=1 Tax=Calothrix TaxID=1186 RepID=UPI0036F3EB37
MVSQKICCKCHHVQPMILSQRIFCCESCGHSQDRDENASVHLENAPIDKVRSA